MKQHGLLFLSEEEVQEAITHGVLPNGFNINKIKEYPCVIVNKIRFVHPDHARVTFKSSLEVVSWNNRSADGVVISNETFFVLLSRSRRYKDISKKKARKIINRASNPFHWYYIY